MNEFTKPLCHKQDVTQGQFLSCVNISRVYNTKEEKKKLTSSTKNKIAIKWSLFQHDISPPETVDMLSNQAIPNYNKGEFVGNRKKN